MVDFVQGDIMWAGHYELINSPVYPAKGITVFLKENQQLHKVLWGLRGIAINGYFIELVLKAAGLLFRST